MSTTEVAVPQTLSAYVIISLYAVAVDASASEPGGPERVQSVVLRQRSAVDVVLHEIRRSILTGDLPPGQPFTVPALTARLGVSHVPVREALRQLEAQGLVVLSPSRSAVVAPLEPGDLRQIYRLRMRLEPELAARSAEQRGEHEIIAFDALVGAAFNPAQSEDDHWDMHRRFHAALIRPAAGLWDFRMLTPLWDAAERYTRLFFDPVGASPTTRNARRQAHDRLISAASSRDAERVQAELHRHLEINLAHTLQAMEAMASSESPRWPSRAETTTY